jgi:hypothetical protein
MRQMKRGIILQRDKNTFKLHIWHWQKLKSLAGKCSSILHTVWTWTLRTTTFWALQRSREGQTLQKWSSQQTMFRLLSDTEIDFYKSSILKFLQNWQKCLNHLRILWNSGRTSPVIHNSISLCSFTFALA